MVWCGDWTIYTLPNKSLSALACIPRIIVSILASREDNDSGQFRLRTNMNAFEVGLGVELYLPFFRLTPSIRGIFSMQDEIVPDDWTVAIQSLKTQGVFLNFIFQ